MRTPFCCAAVAATVLCGAVALQAVPISIINYSFEDIVIPDGYYTVDNVPGWLGEGSWYHIGNPTDANFAGTTDTDPGPDPIDGHNTAAVNNFGHLMYQSLTATVLPGYTYTLTALVGHRYGVPFDNGSVNLIAGDRFLARGFGNPAEGHFTRVTVVYNSPTSGDILGQTLKIELRSSGDIAQGWFDDIHLDATASDPGTIPTLDTAYIPLPPDSPDYAARKDQNFGLFTQFGAGPGDGPTSGGTTSVPESGSTAVCLIVGFVLLAGLKWWCFDESLR